MQPTSPTDFIDGLVTVAGSGDAAEKRGVAIHVFAATKSMDASFYDADGDLLFVAQQVCAPSMKLASFVLKFFCFLIAA